MGCDKPMWHMHDWRVDSSQHIKKTDAFAKPASTRDTTNRHPTSPAFQGDGRRSYTGYVLPLSAHTFVMKYSHLNPEEAYRAFTELGAKTMIPMHYGTFDLSDEPMGEMAAEHLDDIRFLTTGQVLSLWKDIHNVVVC